MAVTREQLSAAIYLQRPDMTHEKARLIVDTVIDEMAKALLEQGKLRIRGFGVFAVHSKPARAQSVQRRAVRNRPKARVDLPAVE